VKLVIEDLHFMGKSWQDIGKDSMERDTTILLSSS